jgi:fibronectin type 3 domain-containing protein
MVGAVPYAPTSLIAEAGDRKVTVRWTAADGRDFSVLSYKVTSTPGGFVCTSEATSCIVTGLTNGVSYTFHVTAISVMGESLPSAESTTQIPAGPPLAPGLVTVVRGSGQAEVRWTAADGNGSDVTGYTVLASPGGRSCVTTTALMCVITGLTNGTEYTFAVSATSIVGTSLPRVSEVVVPAGVATAPISVKAIAGNKTATVSWKKPTNDGGAPITSYRVIASPGGATCVTETGDVLSCSITGLTNGTAYTFTVIAVNGIGNSLPSTASVAVTPSMKPYASTAVTVTMVAAGSVKLNWSGAKRNGATLLKYEYSFRPKSTAAWSAWKSVGTNTFVVLKALTKGKPYQLKVRITTSAGSATSKVLPFTPTK